MSGFGYALTAALVTALQADATVSSLVGANVFDVAPTTTQAPYVYIGPVTGQRLENGAYQMWLARARVYCVSTSFGRDNAWAIIDAISRALDLQTLALDANFIMNEALRDEQSGDVVQPNDPKMTFVDFTCAITRATPLPRI